MGAFSMKPSSKRRVLLVGAGHAHLEFIKSWRASDHELAEFTLITPHAHAIYSGLLPAYLLGEVRRSEIQIDLQSLAERRGIRLQLGRLRSLSIEHRHIVLADGESMEFDDLFINTGGHTPTNWQSTAPRCLHVKPLSSFLDLWEQEANTIQRIAIIGAGAAGIEIAASLSQTASAKGKREVHLIEGGAALGLQLSGYWLSRYWQRRIQGQLNKLGVHLHLNTQIIGLPRHPELALGETRMKFDLILAATPTEPPQFNIDQVEQPMPVDSRLQVNMPTKTANTKPRVWIAGDCISKSPWPRSGVSAVRQGQALRSLWHESITTRNATERKFHLKPQRPQLKLLRMGDAAFGIWGKYSLGMSRLWLRLKSWIDGRYMQSFQR